VGKRQKSTLKQSREPKATFSKTGRGVLSLKDSDMQVIASGVPPFWVDKMELSLRADAPIAMLRFFSIVPPNVLIESSRLQTTASHVKRMIDVLCRSLDYYPTKAEPKAS